MKQVPAGSMGKGALVAGVVWVVLGLLAGCAVSRVATAPDQAMLWHQHPTGAYNTVDGKVFYGVGKAASLQNRTLQRVSADNHARLEMARLLERYSTVLVDKSSPAQIGARDRSKTLEPALKGLVHKAMQRAIVTEHWADPQQGRLLALCRLNLADFEAVLIAHHGLRADIRTAMQANLETVHAQLSQDLLKNQ